MPGGFTRIPISHLRSQLTNLSVEELDMLLKMTAGDCIVLIKSISLFLDSEEGTYHVNVKYLLDRVDLEYCLEVDDGLFYSLFEKLEALEDLSAADLREILHLSNATTRHFINRASHPSAPPDNSIQNLFAGPLSEIIGSAPDEEIFSILANSGKVKSLYMFFEGLSAFRGRIYPTVMEIDEAIKKRRWKPIIGHKKLAYLIRRMMRLMAYNNLDHIKNNHIDNNDNFVMELPQKMRWYEFFMNTREYVFVFSRFGLTRIPGCKSTEGKCGLCISVTAVSEDNPDAFSIDLVTDEASYGPLPIHRHPEITPSRIHLALVSTRWSTFQNSYNRKPFLTADGVRYGDDVYSARSTDELRVIAYNTNMASRTFVKYSLFAFNILFWLCGTFLLVVGLWSKTEKGNLMDFNSMAVDPATVLLVVGALMFWIGFFGWVGALRENVKFLMVFGVSLVILFLAEAAVGILAFIMKEKVKEVVQVHMYESIKAYRDDSDLRDAVNVAQRTFKCCGVKSFTDWQDNAYFKCCNEGIESCGVPYSCCNITLQVNLFCGVNIMDYKQEEFCTSNQTFVPSSNLKEDYGGGKHIYEDGCLDTMEGWFNKNLYYVGGAALGVAIVQVGGVWLSQSLIHKIKRIYVFGHRLKIQVPRPPGNDHVPPHAAWSDVLILDRKTVWRRRPDLSALSRAQTRPNLRIKWGMAPP
eukprot:sb/3462629/